MHKKQAFIGIIGALLLSGIVVTLILVRQSQDTRSRALTPPPPTAILPTSVTPTTAAKIAQACAAPATIANVAVNFPSCEGTQNCNFTQANCTWRTLSDGSSYKVTITEVDTKTKVKEETLAPTIAKTVFLSHKGKRINAT